VLSFFVNNEVAGQWSGTIGGWKREAFYVTAGQKEFTWSYTKNNIGSNGSDCGWLDEIILPPPMALTLWAGPDDEVCYGSAFQLNQSYGTYYQQIQWTTSGGGSFDDNAVMHPVYTPGGDDMTVESVILTMTLTGNDGTIVSDEMILTFKPEPNAPEMPAGPEYIDVTETETSVYTINAVEGSDEYYWVLTPAEAGTIIGNSLQGTVSWNPEFSGTAYVSAGGGNECGFGIASDALEVTVANGTVSINDPAGTEATVSIYPNPATSSINLASTIDIPRADIRIYDLLGNRQYERSGVSLTGNGSFRIDVSSLPKGIYILSVKSSVLNEDIKLIIR
jgi:hypothetical protein